MALATRLFLEIFFEKLEIFLIRFSGSLMEKKKKEQILPAKFHKGVKW
jgi:hypothetical protein